MSLLLPRIPMLVIATVALTTPLPAQVECANVFAGFGPPGANGTVHCLRVFDDGAGPALYLGGSFSSAGTVAASNIAKFDGARWSALGSGVVSNPGQFASVEDLVVFDSGSGPRLVASGRFGSAGGVQAQNIAAWDGATWTALGNGLPNDVSALIAFDDGTGSKLFASIAVGASVVRWNGTTWDALPSPPGVVDDFAVHDDGSGPELYAGGYFSGGGHGVTKWTGAGWTPLAGALGAPVTSLASHDDGSGRKLYAGLDSSVSHSVVRRNGAMWENVGTIGGSVRALEELDLLDGNGPRLRAAVFVPAAAGRVAHWDGSTWSDEGTGYPVLPRALAAFDAGAGRRIFAGSGLYHGSEFTGLGVVRLESATWIAAHAGRGLASEDSVNVLTQHDAGHGPEVHAGGRALSGVPAVVSVPIARWTSGGWVGAGSMPYAGSNVMALESFDLGGGPEFLAGTDGAGVWRNQGLGWVALANSPLQAAYDFQVFDTGTGPLLAAGGNSVQFPGVPRALVRTWNGIVWTTIGESTAVFSRVLALAQFDDGSGPALYCAGIFGALGGVPGTRGIARWNGTSWSSVGGGLDQNESIEVLLVHDDGSGPALYAGGRFSAIGGAPIADIARWNGVAWSPVGASGTTGSIRGVVALAVHDSGAGPKLWAGGDFTSIGGVAANRIARWNGAQWSAFGTGADGIVEHLASFDEGTGSGRTLWAAGGFASIDGVGSSRVARIGCADQPGYAFCFGDAAHGPTACPCGNVGATGHGCASLAAPVGAILEASGTTAPATPGGVDTVSLVCSGLPNATTALFFQGSQRIAPVSFGDGALCIAGNIVRLGIEHASSGIARHPGPGDQPLSVSGQTPFGSGITRYYQVWYRTSASACSSATWNISSGREIAW